MEQVFGAPKMVQRVWNWVKNGPYTLRNVFNEHLFLICALAFSIVFLVFIPQIFHLWWPTGRSHWAFGFICLLLVLGYLYLTTLIRFIWPSLQFGPIFKPAGFINGWLVWLAKSFVPKSERVSGYLYCVAFLALGLAAFLGFSINTNLPYMLFGGYARSAGLWLVLVAVWLLIGRWYGPTQVLEGDTLPHRMVAKNVATEKAAGVRARTGWQASGEVLSWVALMGTIVELLWVTAYCEIPGASYRLYSVGSVFHFAILWPVVAALIDLVHRVSDLPVRIAVVTVSCIFLFVTSGKQVEDVERNDATVSADPWLDTLEKRIDTMKPGPLVLVAASGGGSRAALFASHVLQLLSHEEMESFPEASGLETNEDQGTWAEHILIISSVSGGSLAAARYVHDNGHPVKETVADLRYTTSQELINETAKELEVWASKATGQEQELRTDLPKLAMAVKAVRFKDEQTGVVSKFQKYANMALTSRFSDDMAMDFMAPILRGFATPGDSRGDALYYFWNQQFCWTGIYQNSKSPPDKPLLFINTADADAGRRVIVGFPQVPRGFLTVAKQDDLPLYSPVSLSDFAKDAPELSLARAVRFSSNFPFGFGVNELSEKSIPRLEIDENAPDVRGMKKRRVLRLLDGGAVDNTGIDSLHAIFESLRMRAADQPKSRYARVLKKIRRRGVIILEIDSGAMPSANEGGGLRALATPVNALTNAIYTNALRTSDRMLEELKTTLAWSDDELIMDEVEASDRKAILEILSPRSHAPASALHYRFQCNHLTETSSDVMTAFALGPNDKATVTGIFLTESLKWHAEQEALRNEFLNRNRRNRNEIVANFTNRALEQVKKELQANNISRAEPLLRAARNVAESGEFKELAVIIEKLNLQAEKPDSENDVKFSQLEKALQESNNAVTYGFKREDSLKKSLKFEADRERKDRSRRKFFENVGSRK